MAGIYVHIPFCAKRCIYCGFFSTMREQEAARYVDALCAELHLRRDYLNGTVVEALYLGGGTPSRLTAEQVGRIITAVKECFPHATLKELTMECNPDDVTIDYISALHDLGVNRISMGVQSLDDGMLRFLGRRHTAQEAVQAVRHCREGGVDNVSIDLMYGLPGQTLQMQQQDLEKAIGLDVNHISSYCLSYEEGSRMDRMRLDGSITPLSDELCASMYENMCTMLHQAGYEHYEVSNFCLPGYHSRHNSSYWDGTPYLGIGAGAHSYNGVSRSWAPSDLDIYIKGVQDNIPVLETEFLSHDDRYNEMVMLGLRTSRGIDLNRLMPDERERLLTTASNYISNNVMVRDGERLYISESNIFISDAIISSLFV